MATDDEHTTAGIENESTEQALRFALGFGAAVMVGGGVGVALGSLALGVGFGFVVGLLLGTLLVVRG